MIALLKEEPDAVKKIGELTNKGAPVVTTIITAYELLKGAYLSSKRQENIAIVKEAISNIQVLDLTDEACEEAANIYSELRKHGSSIGEFDILIAAIAKTNQESILTRDKHLKCISGLNLNEW